MKVYLNSISTNWNTLTSQQENYLSPHLIPNSSIDLVNKSRKSTNTIPKTPNLPQKDINGDESVRRIIESETFNDNVFEEMKIENLKTKNNFLEWSIPFWFQKEFLNEREVWKINPSRPNPEEKKISYTFIFTLLCGASKCFMKAFKEVWK